MQPFYAADFTSNSSVKRGGGLNIFSATNQPTNQPTNYITKTMELCS
jgi:hypothetical protein